MVLETILPPPHLMRTPSFKRPYTKYEVGSWSALYYRHRFLLCALSLLTVLCTIYLYFAITYAAEDPCSGLTGPQKASCHIEHVKASVTKTKLRSPRHYF